MTLLTWIFVVVLSIAGHLAAVYLGAFDLIAKYDFTKISYVIMGAYVAGICLTCYCADKKQATIYYDNGEAYLVAKFLARHMLTLGMIGTVIGMIYILNTCFIHLNVENVQMTQAVLVKMAGGMGTAFITTAAGLIYSLQLKLLLLITGVGTNEVDRIS